VCVCLYHIIIDNACLTSGVQCRRDRCRIVDDYCYPYVVSRSPRPGGRCPLPRSHYLLAAAKRCPFPGSPVRVYRAAPPYTVSPAVSIPRPLISHRLLLKRSFIPDAATLGSVWHRAVSRVAALISCERTLSQTKSHHWSRDRGSGLQELSKVKG